MIANWTRLRASHSVLAPRSSIDRRRCRRASAAARRAPAGRSPASCAAPAWPSPSARRCCPTTPRRRRGPASPRRSRCPSTSSWRGAAPGSACRSPAIDFGRVDDLANAAVRFGCAFSPSRIAASSPTRRKRMPSKRRRARATPASITASPSSPPIASTAIAGAVGMHAHAPGRAVAQPSTETISRPL